MNDASQTSTNTFEIVSAATRIVSALDAGSETKLEDHRRSTARSIDAALAAGQPLDDAFVARTVWNTTRDTYSRAYESVMPEHGPLISRAAAFKTHPDDLKALVENGWASGNEDIPTFSQVIDGEEWRMTHGSGRWDVMRRNGQTLSRVLDAFSADEAVKAINMVISSADCTPAEHAADVTASAEPAQTLPGIAELIAQGKLPQLDAATIHAAAAFVTEARAEADRAEETPDPILMAARNAIWVERAVRAEQARLMAGWTDEEGREAKESAMRGVAERIVKLSRMANAIDKDDGLAVDHCASSTLACRRSGREEFDQLAGADGIAAPARLYVIMRQAQRRGEDATVRVAATYCEYAYAGVVTHDEAVTALSSLGDGLTKRMRETVKKQTMQKSGHEASPAVAADKKSGVAAYGTQHWEQSR